MSFGRRHATESMHCDGASTFYPLIGSANGETETNTASSLVDPVATGNPVVAAHVHSVTIACDTAAAAQLITCTFESHDGSINYGFYSGAVFVTSGMNSQPVLVNRTIEAELGFRVVTTGSAARVTVMWSPIASIVTQKRKTGAATTSV